MHRIFVLALVGIQLGWAGAAVTAKPRPQPFFRSRSDVKPKFSADAGTPVVVNAASYLPGVSPGGLATIFGQNLTTVDGIVVATTNPFPTQLANVSVVVNNVLAPLFSIAYANGQDQISFQVPYATATGPGAVTIQVLYNGQDVADLQADSFTEDPGIFLYQGIYAIAAHSDGSLIGPSSPAAPGEIVVVYATGLGPLSLNLIDGLGAPSDPLAYTVDPFNVVVDGEQCDVLFSGLAPGFVGLYQLNIRLPRDLPDGDLDIQIQSSYANSGVAKISVLY